MVNTLMILALFCLCVFSISEGSTKITVEPSDVVEDEPVTLTCTLVTRVYYIKWYRNSRTVARCNYLGDCDDYTSYYNTTMNRLNRTTSVYIQKVSKSRDSGTWKCIDGYYIHPLFTPRTILVVKELSGNLTLICPENLRFIAGQSIDIECKTEVTYPTTNITWYIDTADNRLYKDVTTDIQGGISTSSFRLTPEKQLNNHSLYCSAFNGYGKVQTDFLKLDITYPPTIHIVTEEASAVIAEATSIAIAEGGQLLLTCSVQDANPRVPPHGYTWSRNGIKLIDQTSDIFKVDSTSSHNAGNYTCTGNNGIGTGISSPVKVYVIPRVYEDKSGVVTGLAVGLALSMVLSIVLSLLIAYLILIIRRLATKEVSNYEGLEVGNRDDNQYASSNVASVPDTSPEQEYDNQASDTAATKGDNSLYENLEGKQASRE